MSEFRVVGNSSFLGRVLTLTVLCLFWACICVPSWAGAKKPGIVWNEYETGVALARKDKKFVVVDFQTGWCRDCRKMEAETLSDPDVAKALSGGFVAVKVDGDKRPDLTSRYGVVAYPTILVLDSSGGKVGQWIGYMSKEEFRAFLDYTLTGSYKTMSFKQFNSPKRK